MIFTPTRIAGAFVVDLEPIADERGFFARTFCAATFKAHGLNANVAQCNTTYTRQKGTIRGLHYQLAPVAEAKLIRCTSGAIYEVIVDMRLESSTYLSYVGVELSQANRRMLYIPEMCAAGCQALTDAAEAAYHSGAVYTAGSERGVRYDDPAVAIWWPLPVTTISPKDTSWPLIEQLVRR